MTRDKKLLLDIGGTFIKCSDGRSIPVDSDGTDEEITSSFRKAIFGGGEPPEGGIRIAIPGPFNYSKGIFLMKHKFAAVYGESFANLVGLPESNFRFAHDVVAMLMGEVSPEDRNTALVTLGTGLGFCMYKNGKPFTNELGSPAVSIYSRPFKNGILEDYVSKRGITGRYGHPELSVKEIAQLAFSGDSKAKAVFSETGDILGESIAPILAEHGIKRLLLGGQISRSSELFIPAVKAHLPQDIKVSVVSDIDNATFNGLKKLE